MTRTSQAASKPPSPTSPLSHGTYSLANTIRVSRPKFITPGAEPPRACPKAHWLTTDTWAAICTRAKHRKALNHTSITARSYYTAAAFNTCATAIHLCPNHPLPTNHQCRSTSISIATHTHILNTTRPALRRRIAADKAADTRSMATKAREAADNDSSRHLYTIICRFRPTSLPVPNLHDSDGRRTTTDVVVAAAYAAPFVSLHGGHPISSSALCP